MKRVVILAFLLILSIQFSFSQTLIGIKGGANVSNFTSNQEYQQLTHNGNKNRIGYQVGLIVARGINERLFLRTELYYSIKGARFKEELNNNSYAISLNYLNIPVLIGYKLNSSLSGFLGPQFGILGPVYHRSQGKRSGGDLNNIINYNNFDFGLGAGVMYTITSKITIDLRYTYGFNTIWNLDMTADENGNNVSTAENKNNRTLELSMNYFFRAKP